MSVDIFIPWAHEPGRQHGFTIVDDWLQDEFRNWYAGVAHSPLHPFTRASACNLAAERSTAEVVVFVDADSIAPSEQLREAVELAWEQQGAVRAYDVYHRLSEQATASVSTWKQVAAGEIVWTQERTASHGVWAVHRKTFIDAGGYDPRFVYFYDDLSFDLRAQNIPQPRVKGPLYHLHHPPRQAPDSDEQLWFRYEHEDPFLVRAEVGFPL